MDDKSTCRICLKLRKRSYSIYEEAIEGINYAQIITSIANVKIFKEDEFPDTICYACGKKLQEIYTFKLLIESSHATSNSKLEKRILFNNIKDIKIEFECKIEVDNDPAKSLKLNFDGNDDVVYNDTIIKKIPSKSDHINDFEKPMTLSEFISNFKEDNVSENYNNNYDADDVMDQDYGPDSNEEDYSPETNKLNSSYVEKKKKKKVKEKSKKNGLEIKPVFMEHIRYIKSVVQRRKKKVKQAKENKKLQMCPYCGKMTSGLKSHILLHTAERSFKCDRKPCSKTFYTEDALNNHKKCHDAPKRFKCDHCPASFHYAGAMKSHLLAHSNEKSFSCSICDKKFKRKAAMLRHEKSHNLANKSINCEMCTMSFFTKPALHHHMRIHTGERPYKCELCSQPYSYKRDFTRHCYKKHGVFLKRRAVNVMNQEVLQKELQVMKEVVLRANGIKSDGEPLIPFEEEGPQATLAYQMAIQALQSNENIRF